MLYSVWGCYVKILFQKEEFTSSPLCYLPCSWLSQNTVRNLPPSTCAACCPLPFPLWCIFFIFIFLSKKLSNTVWGLQSDVELSRFPYIHCEQQLQQRLGLRSWESDWNWLIHREQNWEENEWVLAKRTSGCTSVSFSSYLSLFVCYLLFDFWYISLLTGIIFWAQVKLINIIGLYILYEVKYQFLIEAPQKGLRKQLYFAASSL